MDKFSVTRPFSVPLSLRLSGSALKIIALLSMVTDHCAYYLLEHGTPLYELMRCVGRIAFPVFAFLIAEGFAHTNNRTRYFLTLLSFAIISEVPWYLLNGNDGTHNVMFTLAIGVVAIAAFDRLREHQILSIGGVMVFSFLAWKFGSDYDWRGVLMIVIFYMLQRRTIEPWIEHNQINLPCQTLLQIAFTLPLMIHYGIVGTIMASCAIFLYDGTRGFISGKVAKYSFYAIYPAHLLLIAGLIMIMN